MKVYFVLLFLLTVYTICAQEINLKTWEYLNGQYDGTYTDLESKAKLLTERTINQLHDQLRSAIAAKDIQLAVDATTRIESNYFMEFDSNLHSGLATIKKKMEDFGAKLDAANATDHRAAINGVVTNWQQASANQIQEYNVTLAALFPSHNDLISDIYDKLYNRHTISGNLFFERLDFDKARMRTYGGAEDMFGENEYITFLAFRQIYFMFYGAELTAAAAKPKISLVRTGATVKPTTLQIINGLKSNINDIINDTKSSVKSIFKLAFKNLQEQLQSARSAGDKKLLLTTADIADGDTFDEFTTTLDVFRANVMTEFNDAEEKLRANGNTSYGDDMKKIIADWKSVITKRVDVVKADISLMFTTYDQNISDAFEDNVNLSANTDKLTEDLEARVNARRDDFLNDMRSDTINALQKFVE